MNKQNRVAPEAEQKFRTLVDHMHQLRRECPWDREQTPESLRKYILEEAYEVIEMIDAQNWEKLGEELGDLLLQVVFQAAIAEQENRFTITDVIDHINHKLVTRHPHVFGDKTATTASAVEYNWEQIKIEKENRKELLGGIPKLAPALLRAQRIQEKASRAAFDWKNVGEVVEKLEEEVNELKQAINKNNQQNMEEEIGDILFSIVNISRFIDVSAEDALRISNEKFIRRFRYIEKSYDNDYEKMKQAGLKELDKKWDEAKRNESK